MISMEGFKIGFISGILVGGLLFVGWIGLRGLGDSGEYVIREAETVTTEQEFEAEPIATIDPTEQEPVETTPTEPVETPTTSQHTALIADLQKLVDDNVIMKSGSRGTRVGTVQEFLNIYNNTSNTVDNDFGPGTERAVRAFQTAEGLGADGQTGPNTYRKMIEHLESL